MSAIGFSLALAQVTAFTAVTVIDGTDPRPRREQTVVVEGSRIVAVGPAASTPIPAGARRVSGAGKYLIPGLWDMHVHLTVPAGRAALALYVANGVTGVRAMGDDWSLLSGWRREIASGTLVGPRIVASGPYLEGGDVPIPHLVVRTPEEAVQAVDSLARLGVDFVKLHSQFSREAYFAALRAARSRGFRVAGHVPRSVAAREASDSGLSSLEHLLQVPIPCSPAESVALAPRFPVQGVLGRCTTEDLAPLWARFAANGTRVVPTLVAAYEVASWPRRELPGDSFAAYLPDTLRRYVAAIFPMPDSIPPGADSVGVALFRKRIALVGAMHRAGVEVLAGTDAPLRNSPPGFGLHQELALLAEAGLSPFEVLRAATLEAARFLGLSDSLGAIAPGKLADLVLLSKDPLADVRHSRAIAMVMAGGRLFDAAQREHLLRAAAARP